MASIPLASTSRAVFAPASTAPSRLMRRQLLLQAGYARPISSIACASSAQAPQRRRQRQQFQQQIQSSQLSCRYASSSTGKGMGNRALPEESHINPNTGLGGSNTEQSLLSKQHTKAGSASGKSLATVSSSKAADARHTSHTSGSAEVVWIAKQLEMMERRDNMKNEAPIKVCVSKCSCLVSFFSVFRPPY